MKFGKHVPDYEMSEFKQPYLLNPERYFVQTFRIYQTYHLLSNDRRLTIEFIHVSSVALSRSGLLLILLIPTPEVRCPITGTFGPLAYVLEHPECKEDL